MVASNFAFKWDQNGEDLDYGSEFDDKDDGDFGFIMPPQPGLHMVNDNEVKYSNEELDKDVGKIVAQNENKELGARVEAYEIGVWEENCGAGALEERDIK